MFAHAVHMCSYGFAVADSMQLLHSSTVAKVDDNWLTFEWHALHQDVNRFALTADAVNASGVECGGE